MYNSIESPISRSIVRECRGLILREEEGNYSVIARGYDKFFRLDEGAGDDIDWKTARAYEKLDGTLLLFYWYGGQWNVSTKGVPDAAQFCDSGISFANLFWNTFRELDYSLPPSDWQNYCFMFELLTLDNRVVIPHPVSRLVLHGARFIDPDNHYFPEYDPYSIQSMAEAWLHWELPDAYPVGNEAAVRELVNSKDGTVFEGLVLVDHTFTRAKVKNPLYHDLHEAMTDLTLRAVVRMVMHEHSEIITAYYPEYAVLFFDISQTILCIKKDVLNLITLIGKSSGSTKKKERNLWVKAHLKGDPHFNRLRALLTMVDNEGLTIDEAFERAYRFNDLKVKNLILTYLDKLEKVDTPAFRNLISFQERGHLKR
jgi:hypothetical protein